MCEQRPRVTFYNRITGHSNPRAPSASLPPTPGWLPAEQTSAEPPKEQSSTCHSWTGGGGPELAVKHAVSMGHTT